MIKLADARVSESGIEAVSKVLRSGQLIAGAENVAFERELADYLGCAEVVLVSSGTAALHLTCLALEIGPGDAVIVPDFTFVATANAVAVTGAVPVIADVEPGTYNLSPVSLEKAIVGWQGPERLAAVMPVHEFGRCADMSGILAVAAEHQLPVIEDAACALGSLDDEGRRAGSMGVAGCFSFHPRKSMTTGEGGAISTNSPELADRLRLLRNHGMRRGAMGMSFDLVGLNYRLTDFQAALGRVQLGLLPHAIEVRREVARAYQRGLQGLVRRGALTLPETADGHSWQTYMVDLDERVDRAVLIEALRGRGVEASVGAQSLSEVGLFPRRTMTPPTIGPQLHRRGLALPCHQALADDEVSTVISALSEALEESWVH